MTEVAEVKILMAGPKSSGKSALANFIADAVQNSETPSQAPTQPTKGVRIVEFSRQIRTAKGPVSEVVHVADALDIPPHPCFRLTTDACSGRGNCWDTQRACSCACGGGWYLIQ